MIKSKAELQNIERARARKREFARNNPYLTCDEIRDKLFMLERRIAVKAQVLDQAPEEAKPKLLHELTALKQSQRTMLSQEKLN